MLTLQLGLTCSLFKPSVSEIREMQGLMYFATRNLVVLLTFKLENSELFYVQFYSKSMKINPKPYI